MFFYFQEASFEYGSNSSSEINHGVLFRDGQTRSVSFKYYLKIGLPVSNLN